MIRMFDSLFLLIGLFFSSCIGEDIVGEKVEESLTITTQIEQIEIGTSFQLEATYLNEAGMNESANMNWVSEDESIISIDNTGLIMALTSGDVDITVSLEGRFDLSDVIRVNSGMTTSIITTTERTGALRTTSTYTLTGDFSLVETDSGLELKLAENFQASSTLPGLYVYLTNNSSTNSGALEISRITKFSGASTFSVPGNVDIKEYNYVLFYCKPFSAKVGDGMFEEG